MNELPYHTVSNYSDYLQKLQLACDWMNIKKGRCQQYLNLISELFNEDKRSREHILACNESYEVIEIYELWKSSIDNFPGLGQRIKQVLKKGPILREDERLDSSTNRPRNDAFVYLLAGKLIKAGLKVIAVDHMIAKNVSCHTYADISFLFNGSTIDIECKRPQSQGSIRRNMKHARKQLKQGGIIAFDCSAFLRPAEHLIEADSIINALEFLDNSVDQKVKPIVETHFDIGILGFLLYARTPAMIRTKISQILSPGGNPIVHLRPECISTWLAIPNPLNPQILKSVSLFLRQSFH